MKTGIACIFISLLFSSARAQNEVKWDFSYNVENSQLVAHARIGDGWHLYSTKKASELGPIPTEFEFDKHKGIELVGAVMEPEPIVAFDTNFEETLYYFEKEVSFTQKLKVSAARELEGTVTYMVCNEEMCMPPVDYKFRIELAHED